MDDDEDDDEHSPFAPMLAPFGQFNSPLVDDDDADDGAEDKADDEADDEADENADSIATDEDPM